MSLRQAGRPRWWAAGLSLALLVVLAVVLVARGQDDPLPEAPVAAVARPELAMGVLDGLEDAIRSGDQDEVTDLASSGDEATALVEAILANAADLRIRDLSLRYVDEDGGVTARLPEGQWAAAVDTTWRYGGADRRTANAEVTFVFAAEGEDAGLASVGGGGRRTPLWLSEELSITRTGATVVSVAGGDTAPYDAFARRAVTVVRRVLPAWRGALVVEVPGTADGLARMLGADEGEYAAIAAVTATADGTSAPGSPLRVFVNPEVLAGLEARGAQVVMSHEAAHVATEAPSASSPLWLLEGFADYVALRDLELPLSITAGQILRQVRQDGLPDGLPAAAEFDTRTTHLGAAYEAAWLACRVLARAAGEDALVELNRRVGEGADLEEVLQDVTGFGVAELTRRWRQELARLAR